MRRRAMLSALFLSGLACAGPLPDLSGEARLVLEEDWSSGKIDPSRWYALSKQWGQGNNGVVPGNLAVVEDRVDGRLRHVLRCRAHGDDYRGTVAGRWGRRERVGAVLVSKQFFASGRFEVTMRMGDLDDPAPPGMVPAIWTYAGRAVRVAEEDSARFHPSKPLYHPALQQWGKGNAFYWTEIDFPEFGKEGDYSKPLYNTFINKKHDSKIIPVEGVADGRYHTYVTEWRTHLVPFPEARDEDVVEAEGFHWVATDRLPLDAYHGNPLKRLGPDRYAVHAGKVARHWIDGAFVGENTELVPSLAAQLNLGVWLPDWAGPAPWASRSVSFADVRVWQYGDPGDVFGVITEDIPGNIGKDAE